MNLLRILALALLAFTALLFAQAQAPPPPPPSEPAQIRTSSSEVLLDLIVRDKKGRVIRDLTPADLEVLDDGKPIAIRSLRLNSNGGETASAAPTQGDPMREIKFTTLVFESMSREAAALARPAAITFVNKAVGPRSLAGVFLIRRGLRALTPYTTDKAILKRAIDSATGSSREQPENVAAETAKILITSAGAPASTTLAPSGAPPSQGEIDAMVEALRRQMAMNMTQAFQTIEMETASRPSLTGLRAAIDELRKLPGRKTVLYLTELFQIPPATQPQFQALIAAANAANVSVYCVDANGLLSSERTAAAADKLREAVQASMEVATSRDGDAVSRGQVMAFDTAEESIRTGNFSALQELASSTGGTLVADSNDFSGPMARVAEDIATHYELTYAPEIATYDGKFRPVTVKVKRKGIRVQSRSGYFALPPGAGMNVAPHEIPLLAAVDTRPTAFPFQSGLFRMSMTGSGAQAKIAGEAVVEVPLGAVELEEDPAARLFRLKIAFLVQFRNRAGEVVHKLSRYVMQAGPIDQLGRAKAGNFVWTQQFELPPGEYTAHFVVMDRVSERISTAQKEWTAALGPLSDLVLVKRVEQLQPGKSWLATEQVRIVPSFAEQVNAADGQVSLFFRARTEDGESPVVELAVKRDGVEQARAPLPVKSDAGKEFPYVASIGTASLATGAYEFEVTVKQGSRISRGTLALKVAGAPTAPAAGETASAVEEATASPGLSIQPVELTNAMAAPPAEEQARIVESARAFARDYLKSLPNFFCVQFTRRLNNPKADGTFVPVDRFQEILSFVDGKENYQSLQLAWPPPPDDGSRGSGVSSRGEWGGLMGAVFDKDAAAKFTWKSTGEVGGELVHVFDYEVDAAHSQFSLTWGGKWKGKWYPKSKPSYRGSVQLDAETLRIRRLTLAAKVAPGEFPIEETTHEVDYDLQQLGGTEYLLPKHAVMQARIGRKKVTRNEIDFRDFRKWGAGSELKIP